MSTLPWYIQRPGVSRRRRWNVGGPGDEWTQGGGPVNTSYSNPESKTNTSYSNPDSAAKAPAESPETFVAKVGALYDMAAGFVAGSPGDTKLTEIGVAIGNLLGKAQEYLAAGTSMSPLVPIFNSLKTQLGTWKSTHTNAPVAPQPPVAAPPPPVAQAPAPPKAPVPPPAAPVAPPTSAPAGMTAHSSAGLGKYMTAETAAYAVGGVGAALLLAKMLKLG